jgi:hypothetical protein
MSSLLSKAKKLLTHPKEESWRIVPFLKSRLFFYKKKVLEFLEMTLSQSPIPVMKLY